MGEKIVHLEAWSVRAALALFALCACFVAPFFALAALVRTRRERRERRARDTAAEPALPAAPAAEPAPEVAPAAGRKRDHPLAHALVVCLAVVMGAPKLSRVQPLRPIDTSYSMAGKTVVITGGTSGIGLEAARDFSGRGARVVLTGRSASRAVAAAASLPGGGGVSRAGGGYDGDKGGVGGEQGGVAAALGLALDLTDHESVRAFASQVKALLAHGVGSSETVTAAVTATTTTAKLDVLVLNAGMAYGPKFAGPFISSFPGGSVDAMVAANHLGHFLLLQELIGILVDSGTRVVVVSSTSHHLALASDVDTRDACLRAPLAPAFTDGQRLASLGAAGGLKMFNLYASTKLLNVLVANKLARLFAAAAGGSKATVVVATPGFAATAIGAADRGFSGSKAAFNPLDYLPLTFSAQEGGAMIVQAAAVDARLLAGKVLMPYWIWESAPLPAGPLKGVFHNFVQEVLCQKLTAGLYAHSASAEGLDEGAQDRAWAWSLKAVIGN